jgi:hypothetical protein
MMTDTAPHREAPPPPPRHKVSLLVREIVLSATDEADYVALLREAFPGVRIFVEPTYAQRHAADPPDLTWIRDFAPFAESLQIVHIVFDSDWAPTWRQFIWSPTAAEWTIDNMPALYGHWERSGQVRPARRTRPDWVSEYMTSGRLWFAVRREQPTSADDLKRARKALRLFARLASKQDLAVYSHPELEYYRVDKEAPWAGRDARAWCTADPRRLLGVETSVGWRPFPQGSVPPPPPVYVTALRERKPVAGSWAGTPVPVGTAEREGVGVYFIGGRVAVPGVQFIERRLALLEADEIALLAALREVFPRFGLYPSVTRSHSAEGCAPNMLWDWADSQVVELCPRSTAWNPRFRLDEQSLEWVLVNRIYPWALWQRSQFKDKGKDLLTGVLSFRLLRDVKSQRKVVGQALACIDAVASNKNMLVSQGDAFVPIDDCRTWVGHHAREWCLADPKRRIVNADFYSYIALRPAPPPATDEP